ncbi:signal peptide peptidase SppA [Candidatus Margulisiibacteriota bacterium]
MKREKWIIYSLIALFLISILIGLLRQVPINKSVGQPKILLPKDGIAVIYIYGPIFVDLGSPIIGASGIDSIVEQLNAIEKDKHIRGVVLRINSPGGSPGASQELYNEILKFKDRTKLPVTVSIADVGASGAYWVSLAGDTIFANAASIIGSIGVIIQNLDLSEVKEKYGIGIKTIKTAEYKDAFSPWRKTSGKENRHLKNLADNIHKQFVSAIAESRKQVGRKAASLADGKIYTGEQAIKVGLIDKIGGMEDAISYTGKMAGIKGKPRVITRPGNPIHKFFKYWQQNMSSFFGSSSTTFLSPSMELK